MSEEITDIKEETEAVVETAAEETVAEETVAEAEETAAVAEETATEAVTEASEEVVSEKPASSEEKSPIEEKVEERDEKQAVYDKERMPRVSKFKKKVCRFCNDSKVTINYKDKDMLEDFITDRGKILPRRVTGTCAKHQRDVAREIKRGRAIAIIPFVEQ